jgi:alpha-L-rhamnosidase
LALVLGFLAATSAGWAEDDPCFRLAKPIWLADRETEMNVTVGFSARFEVPESATAQLKIAAASIYRVHINGQFLACGPARGPHGFHRVDHWDLDGQLRSGVNVLAIEVAGYNANSYYLLDQPSFLQAEVTSGQDVLASTGTGGASFHAVVLDDRVQKVQRYSFQRPFVEVYELGRRWDHWRTVSQPTSTSAETAVQPERRLLPRRVLYPTFTVRNPISCGPHGTIRQLEGVSKIWKDRSLTNIGPELKGYAENQLAVVPSVQAQHYRSVPKSKTWRPYGGDTSLVLEPNTYQILDLGT